MLPKERIKLSFGEIERLACSYLLWAIKMRRKISAILLFLLFGCSSEPVSFVSSTEQTKKYKMEAIPEKKKCDKYVALEDLNIDSQNWDQMEQDTVFSEIVDQLFAEWEKTDLECMENNLKNLIYACNMSIQVDNGGITSFVDNGSGEFFHETLNAIKELKMHKFQVILEGFQALFPNKTIPKDMEERRKLMDVILENSEDSGEPFETWDNTIYSNRAYFQIKIVEYVKNITSNSAEHGEKEI